MRKWFSHIVQFATQHNKEAAKAIVTASEGSETKKFKLKQEAALRQKTALFIQSVTSDDTRDHSKAPQPATSCEI